MQLNDHFGRMLMDNIVCCHLFILGRERGCLIFLQCFIKKNRSKIDEERGGECVSKEFLVIVSAKIGVKGLIREVCNASKNRMSIYNRFLASKCIHIS